MYAVLRIIKVPRADETGLSVSLFIPNKPSIVYCEEEIRGMLKDFASPLQNISILNYHASKGFMLTGINPNPNRNDHLDNITVHYYLQVPADSKT